MSSRELYAILGFVGFITTTVIALIYLAIR
jgi:hypothetical protein